MYLKRCCQSHVSFTSAYFSCRSQQGNYWPRLRSQSSWAAVPVSYSHPSEGLGLWSLRRTSSAGFPLQTKQNNDLISLSFKGINISALTRDLDVMENTFLLENSNMDSWHILKCRNCCRFWIHYYSNHDKQDWLTKLRLSSQLLPSSMAPLSSVSPCWRSEASPRSSSPLCGVSCSITLS